MKLENGKISILINQNETTIEVTDSNSSVCFCKVTLTAEQFCQALGRLMYTDCKLEVTGLDKVGKKMENKRFDFEIPDRHSKDTLSKLCQIALEKENMLDWTSDNYYNSQNSFYKKDEKQYASVVIRRWI